MEAAVSAGRPTTSNALHVNLSRLRKRLAPLGLVIRRVRSRGYVMESVQEPSGTKEGRPSPLAKRAKSASAGQPAGAGHREGPDLPHRRDPDRQDDLPPRYRRYRAARNLFDVLLLRLYRLGDRVLKR
jgi:hypothetical protein